MPEIRQNIATREWVIIATERAKRPEQFIREQRERVTDRPPHATDCPFCPGNEELDLERLRIPATGDWQLRAVANRFPALQESDEAELPAAVGRALAGVGYHEVLVESRLHNTCPALESLDEVERTLQGFQLRGQAMHNDRRIAQIIYFKNHGVSAGASLLHPHTQILALPVVPSSIQGRVEVARHYHNTHGECVICHIRADEEREQVRVVAENRYFTAFVPYAALSPFHIWIVPRRHSACFLDATPEERTSLACLLRDVLRRLYYGLNDPDFNYAIRSAPEQERNAPYFHWYLTVVPRVSRTAGFEIGSGMYINTSLPEESARFLRDVSIT